MIKILDHGYVKLIETWGSDERVIEAARMSTGKGFLGWGTPEQPGDEKLLAYLYNNSHYTPFEMAGMIIEVKAPILVYREWHRHRTQCLSGDTKITLVTNTSSAVTYKRTIKQIFDLRHGGVEDREPAPHRNGYSKAGTPVTRPARRKVPWRTRVLPNCQTRLLRVLNEETGEFTIARMKEVWKSGVKDIYSLNVGRMVINASALHPFLTERGWVQMKDIVIGDRVARMGKVVSQERAIPPSLRQGIVRWETVTTLPMYVGQEMTYDIEVEGPHHNYVANDIVVHNSYNEMSARYTPLPDENYMPTVERLMRNAGGTNKQAGTVKGSEEMTRGNATTFQHKLREQYRQAQDVYEWALKVGVPKELARVHLPVARYSRMRAGASLRNWLAFLTLRDAPSAQWEIQQYAKAVSSLIAENFPRTHSLYVTQRSS
jgi:flavin-dependent thymidylate synthase